ncbi:MAG TPA: anthranilate synthase component I family protein [Atribacteraceae bacterium]|nr:anthranilate synthase component I family protein [Atribacteraceae bacterium]
MGQITPNRDTFLHRSKQGYDYIPIQKSVLADRVTTISLFDRLRNRTPVIFLESAERGENWGRYSFLVLNVDAEYRMNEYGDCILDLEKRFPPASVYPEPDLPFLGGAVGFFSYDAVKCWEERVPRKPGSYPLTWFVDARRFLFFDHLKHRMGAVALVPAGEEESYRRAEEWVEETMNAAEQDGGPRRDEFRLTGEFRSNFTREDFENSVREVRRLIEEGHASQVVLSQKFSAPFTGDPFVAYRVLRSLNPSPYLYYLDAGDFQIAGSSPEMLVKLENGILRTKPIAGTRRRRSAGEEAAIIQDLMADEKERAEHIMLLDLGRNDLGRVCRSGTVAVEEFMKVERYSHVYHITSTVSGQLKEGLNSWRALAACFPAGTVSGAPKVRAMQVIEDLEPDARGPYAGALGYVSLNGSMDTCIVIRSMYFQNGTVTVQAGAGIVYDSVPENEYEETRSKAEALLLALQEAGRR